MSVTIIDGLNSCGTEIEISTTAAALVGLGKNKVTTSQHLDAMTQAENVKKLAAAMVTLCEDFREDTQAAGRAASIAITHIETAAMFATKSASQLEDRTNDRDSHT